MSIGIRRRSICIRDLLHAALRAALPGPEDRLKRLLTIGHSYVVAQNRRLAHELALHGAGTWEVTVAAPARLRGDLRDITLEPITGEAATVVPLPVWLGGHAHLRVYGLGVGALLRRRWDVVHCWEEPYVLAAAQIARGIPSAARFVPATFQNIAKRYPAVVSAIERGVMNRADGWIAFGKTVFDTHRDRPGYASKPSRVINPGVDTAAFRPDAGARQRIRTRLGWTLNDKVAGFSGRFVAEKGIATLLDTFTKSVTPWNLLFVGGGPLLHEIEAVRARFPSRLRIVTDVPHDEVPDYLNAMDILCAPSRSTPRWREQFGRMLIEAMACGVAVLASPSGEIPHVVAGAGVLVAEDDTAAWAHEIDRLLSDDRARAELSALGVARARSAFAWPVVARAHLDFFEELLAR